VAKNQMRDAIAAHVARILREEREKRGLSMTVLAQRAGLSQSMISFVEREIRNPSLETLLRIAEVFELNLGEIIKRAYKAAAKSK
jgi:transcriptional regulator with XRE-family HTH domain